MYSRFYNELFVCACELAVFTCARNRLQQQVDTISVRSLISANWRWCISQQKQKLTRLLYKYGSRLSYKHSAE